jgi:hypothetical protein
MTSPTLPPLGIPPWAQRVQSLLKRVDAQLSSSAFEILDPSTRDALTRYSVELKARFDKYRDEIVKLKNESDAWQQKVDAGGDRVRLGKLLTELEATQRELQVAGPALIDQQLPLVQDVLFKLQSTLAFIYNQTARIGANDKTVEAFEQYRDIAAAQTSTKREDLVQKRNLYMALNELINNKDASKDVLDLQEIFTKWATGVFVDTYTRDTFNARIAPYLALVALSHQEELAMRALLRLRHERDDELLLIHADSIWPINSDASVPRWFSIKSVTHAGPVFLIDTRYKRGDATFFASMVRSIAPITNNQKGVFATSISAKTSMLEKDEYANKILERLKVIERDASMWQTRRLVFESKDTPGGGDAVIDMMATAPAGARDRLAGLSFLRLWLDNVGERGDKLDLRAFMRLDRFKQASDMTFVFPIWMSDNGGVWLEMWRRFLANPLIVKALISPTVNDGDKAPPLTYVNAAIMFVAHDWIVYIINIHEWFLTEVEKPQLKASIAQLKASIVQMNAEISAPIGDDGLASSSTVEAFTLKDAFDEYVDGTVCF